MNYMRNTQIEESNLRLAGPLYLQVADHMRNRISAGEWPPNIALPNEGELSLQYRISLGTMRKALEHLVRSKLLIRYQGRGTFVIRGRSSTGLRYWPMSLDTLENLSGCETSSSLISVTTAFASAADAALLKLPADAGVEILVCLTRICESTASHDVIIVPSAFGSGPIEQPQAQSDAFPEALVGLMSTVVQCSDRITPALASQEVATLLGIRSGDPVLSIERLAVDRNNRTLFIMRRTVTTSGPIRYALTH